MSRDRSGRCKAVVDDRHGVRRGQHPQGRSEAEDAVRRCARGSRARLRQHGPPPSRTGSTAETDAKEECAGRGTQPGQMWILHMRPARLQSPRLRAGAADAVATAGHGDAGAAPGRRAARPGAGTCSCARSRLRGPARLQSPPTSWCSRCGGHRPAAGTPAPHLGGGRPGRGPAPAVARGRACAGQRDCSPPYELVQPMRWPPVGHGPAGGTPGMR